MRAALVFAILAFSACAYKPWFVPRDKPIVVQPNEGLVALAVDSDQSVSIALCRDANLASCIELGPVSRNEGAVVARVHEGRHCIMQLAFEAGDTGHVESSEAKNASCVNVEAGRIAYVGHLILEVSPMGNTSYSKWRSRWQDRSDVMRTMVDANYPHLAQVPLATTSVGALAIPDD
jgi:hypothetical protein